ncbi:MULTISPECIES: acyl carrier protein [unclassified Nodularia (in: cyanobacteria)]|uniref:acyl carrier protein n=1 Tax=unclassified Nodularia (in: cyanobacteria) TaxID=2656917 RepID=UPI00187FD394|nr:MULTISPECIES: acyl carrier protein [unclassified Nodularia (in: cyanobacteria)]MBE9201703.1 acyl carrier protein [Nodularia sp. LEGE 06071]MCC2691268.1 acyl carrier protein [Nodularia sp. LEGE 04288]
MDTVKAIKNLEDILKDLGIPEDMICPNALINQDLQLDSTEIVEVSLALKRKLGIKVKLETRQDKTLTEICTLIESALSETESQNSI